MARSVLLWLCLCFLSPAVCASEMSDADSALMRGDYAKAAKIFDVLSDAGNATAMVRLASLYQRGEGVDRDIDKAVALYLSAAELGHAEAQFNLGNMYLLGEGLPQDEDWALTFYRLAAKQGHGLARHNMRELYRANGIDVAEPDPPGVGSGDPGSDRLGAVAAAVVESVQSPTFAADPNDRGPEAGTEPAADPVLAEAAPENEASAAAMEAVAGDAGSAPLVVEDPIEVTVDPLSADEAEAIRLAREHGIEVKLIDDPPPTAAVAGAQRSAAVVAGASAPEQQAARFEGAKRALTLENFEHGIDKLTRLAEDGYGDAALLLADMADRGRGMPPDAVLAMVWRQRAAALGSAQAQYQLAERYLHGHGLEPDEAMAITLYRDAARSGHLSAIEKLRSIYSDADLPMPDFARPRESDDVEPGSATVVPTGSEPRAPVVPPTVIVTHPPAYAQLSSEALIDMEPARPENHQVLPGSILIGGRRSTPQSGLALSAQVAAADGSDAMDPSTAVEEDRPVIDPLTEINIAELIAPAQIAEFDDAKPARVGASSGVAGQAPGTVERFGSDAAAPAVAAVSREPPAADATIDDAKLALAERRFAAAVDIFARLAEEGDVEAAAHLGYLYSKGEGVEPDLAQAIDWYRRAAVHGNRDAQYNLAVAYAFGEGVAQDDAEAATWYRRAAEQGSAIAQYSLGVSYALGEGVMQDDVEAVKWYRGAAEQGYAAAQYNLAYCYRAGHGVEADDGKALRWFAAAARNGHASAQYSLGYMYRSGRGVTRDLDEAIKWYREAAAQGHPDARADLASLNK